MEKYLLVLRLVSADSKMVPGFVFRGYVEILTLAAGGSMIRDVVHCGLLRETEAQAYFDAVDLKQRLGIVEIVQGILQR